MHTRQHVRYKQTACPRPFQCVSPSLTLPHTHTKRFNFHPPSLLKRCVSVWHIMPEKNGPTGIQGIVSIIKQRGCHMINHSRVVYIFFLSSLLKEREFHAFLNKPCQTERKCALSPVETLRLLRHSRYSTCTQWFHVHYFACTH